MGFDFFNYDEVFPWKHPPLLASLLTVASYIIKL